MRFISLRMPGRARLALLGGSVVFALAMAELGARAWLAFLATPDQARQYESATHMLRSSDLKYVRHPYLNFAPMPNWRRGAMSHNSLGFRGAEFPHDKPAGEFRIAVLGGSSVYSTGVPDDDEVFTAVMEKMLAEDYGYRQVRIINAGVPNYNSWETLINLVFRVMDVQPDLVIVNDGVNDVHARFCQPEAYRADGTGVRQQWESPPPPFWVEHCALYRIMSRKFGWTHEMAIQDLVEAPTALVGESRRGEVSDSGLDPAAVLKRNPPTYYRRNLTDMAAVARAHGVKIVFATWPYSPEKKDYMSLPYYQQGVEEMNQVMAEVAQSVGAPLFDLAAQMPKDRKYWEDGRHENPAGAEIKARLFAQFLDENGLIGDTWKTKKEQ